MKKRIAIYKKKSKKTFMICLFYLLPIVTFAQQGVIPCGPGSDSGEMCKLEDVPVLINKIMDFIMKIVTPLAIVSFVIGGVYMMFAPAKEANYSKGKSIMINTVWGMLAVFGSWLIVKTILYMLGYKEAFSWVETGV